MPCQQASGEASDGGEAAFCCLAATSRYWHAKSRVAALVASPFESASTYCNATDAAGDKPLDLFFEDAASAGVIMNDSHAATHTMRAERERPLKVIMTTLL